MQGAQNTNKRHGKLVFPEINLYISKKLYKVALKSRSICLAKDERFFSKTSLLSYLKAMLEKNTFYSSVIHWYNQH